MTHDGHARSDAELIARVLEGRADAFAPLVERHQAALYRHARGMGLDPDSAEDMVQDCFVKAYVALRECRSPEHFRTWLFRILRNCCLDHLKNVRQRVLPLDAVAATDSALHARGALDLVHELDDALARLSPLLREAFLLKHEAGYTYDEIAGITDSSPSAVKMRVHRARDELRAALALEAAEAM
jgi:RNA polymerase sigma-70 factor (ECF subfamily)